MGSATDPLERPLGLPGTLHTEASRQVHLYASTSVSPIDKSLLVCANSVACDTDVDDDESSNVRLSDGKPLSPSAMAMLVQCLVLQVPPSFNLFQAKL